MPQGKHARIAVDEVVGHTENGEDEEPGHLKLQEIREEERHDDQQPDR